MGAVLISQHRSFPSSFGYHKVINFIDVSMYTFALSLLVISQRFIAVPERVFKGDFQNSALTIHYAAPSPQGQEAGENLD